MFWELLTCKFLQNIITKALQPNMNIRADIAAPLERGEKVLEEITRQVFSLLK